MWDEVPEPVRRHLEAEILTPALVAWARVDEDGRVLEGQASAAEIAARLTPGALVDEALPVLVGMLPLHGKALTLRSVELEGSLPVDVHVFDDASDTWTVLVDEGERGRIYRALLQTANEQALDEARASAARERLAEVARGLEVAVFEPLGEERLRLVSRAPEWLERQCPGLEPGDALEARAISDYAADFLVTELHAALGGGRIQRASLPWTEEVPGTGLMSRECVVGRTPSGRRFFLVRRLGLDLVDRSAPIQAGRDLGLLYERLSREIEEKDILLHGIFHDLSNPLTNVINAVELLEGSLSAEEEELRAIALDESLRQRTVLRTLLEVFRAERLVHEPDPPETAGLLSGIQTLRSGLELAAKLRGLELAFELPEQEMTVIGDAIRLERIIQNLAENAFRVSPAGGRVRVGAEAREDRALVYVEDEGPGVPEVDRAVIFDKLRRGGDGGGKLGLGLYFCRLTARRWGGEVRHANLEPRGSRFEVELVRADPPARPRPGGTG